MTVFSVPQRLPLNYHHSLQWPYPPPPCFLTTLTFKTHPTRSATGLVLTRRLDCFLISVSLPPLVNRISLDVLSLLGIFLVCALKILQLCSCLLLWYVCTFFWGADLDLLKNFGQYQLGQFPPPPQTYDSSVLYLLGKSEHLQCENTNLTAALQLLK